MYIDYSDLRPESSAEFAAGLELDDATVGEDSLITDAIARQSERFDLLTNDHFETAAGIGVTLRGDGTSRLLLPKRCTAVTSVEVVNWQGTSTTQDASVWRLHSSLDAEGAKPIAKGAQDWLDVVPYRFISGASFGLGYGWPDEPSSIIVTGTFGWTVTPADVKRAVALLVFAEFKPQADILNYATQVSDTGTVYQLSQGKTGIPRVDEVIESYAYGPVAGKEVFIG